MGERTIEGILQANRGQVGLMQEPASIAETICFREKHAVRIMTLCRSDGRIPTGAILFDVIPTVITTERSPGGAYKLGWTRFGRTLAHEIIEAGKSHSALLVPCISHYSMRGGEHNCAACKHSRPVAFEKALSIYTELRQCRNMGGVPVYPLLFELETDEGEVALWSEDHEHKMTAREAAEMDDAKAEACLGVILGKTIPERMLSAVLRLLRGNAKHVAERAAQGLEYYHHDESILAVGSYYQSVPTGWALRSGPFRPVLKEGLAPLCEVLAGSLRQRRDNGIDLTEVKPILMVTLPLQHTVGEPFITQSEIRLITDGVRNIMRKSSLAELIGEDLRYLDVLMATVEPNGLFVPFN